MLKIIQFDNIIRDLKMLITFTRRYMRYRYIATGFLIALTVFILRAYTNGSIIPLAIKDLTDAVGRGNIIGDGKGIHALIMLCIATIIMVGTEWMFKPYFSAITRFIVDTKKNIIKKVDPINSDRKDLIGRIGSDVDFAAWNISAMYTTVTPNILTAIVSSITLYTLNPAVGIINMMFIPIPFIVLNQYVKRVESARMGERTMYSESLYYIQRLVEGDPNAHEILISSLNGWYKNIQKIIHLDRFYWSSTLAYLFTTPMLSILILLKGNIKVTPGDVAGIISATMQLHSSLINGLWGLAILGQTIPAIERILNINERR